VRGITPSSETPCGAGIRYLALSSTGKNNFSSDLKTLRGIRKKNFFCAISALRR
jgi:hypothetical protein